MITYISNLLKEKLKNIASAKTATILAPAGFGKTTATHFALSKVPPTQQHWYTADKTKENLGNELYDWFLNELKQFDSNSALKLSELGYFNRANRSKIKNILKEINSDNEQYIIIDNLQYIFGEIANFLIAALASSACKTLRLIVISQYLSEPQKQIFSESDCYCLTEQDLSLSKEDIADFSKEFGMNFSSTDVEKLMQKTDGWIVSVSLYLQKASEFAVAPYTADVDTLLGDICWQKIDAAERHTLLYFTIWQTITYGCFLHINSKDSGSLCEEKARKLMSKMPLIKFNPTVNGFTMHNIFRDFIAIKFNDISNEERNGILTVAGEYEKEKGRNRRAISLFFSAKNYAGLLSCNMNNMLMEKLDGVEFKDIALDVCKNCDNDILSRYPLSALKLCYVLYGSAQFAEYSGFIAKMRDIVAAANDNNLWGEWYLVSAFSVFPDILQMTAIYQKAADFFTKPSELFTYDEPYLFGCTSMWYLFYTKVGEMEKTADDLDKMIAIYNSLTNGHAAGAEKLYRAEANCVQAKFDEAEILVRTAARMAEVKKNVSVVYGSALILGIICIYQDDMVGLEEAVNYLENRAIGYDFMQNTALNKYMTETVRGYLLALLLETKDSSQWTREWTCSGTELTFTNFMAKTAQITDIILHKEYKKAIANIEATLLLDKRLISLPTSNFMRVGLALCYLAVGNLKDAMYNLEISLTLSEQDKNYTFLACFRKYLALLMMFPSLRDKHKVAIEEIKNLNLSYSVVRKKAIFDFVLTEVSALSKLTDRELEIAKMAVQGKRNKEIANELFVSEYTVKNHLALIYQKLNIDRRSRLIDMLK